MASEKEHQDVEIPLGARIIHVADALDALMNARVYRAGGSLDGALTELRRRAGPRFCPRCVDAAIAVAEPGDTVATSDRAVAFVARAERLDVLALPNARGRRP